jgi:hypothetical protein
MPWGFFGPVEFRTRRGAKVTFVGAFITLPLTAWSLWQLGGWGKPNTTSVTSGPKQQQISSSSQANFDEAR